MFAQESSFTAKAPATVQMGQQFQYTIEGNERGSIQLPDLKNFELLGGPFQSFSSSTRWVNGKMTAETTASYTFVLRAAATGEQIIPAAKVKVNKENYETNPVKINVVGSSSGQSGRTNANGSTISSRQDQASTVEAEEQPVFLRVLPSRKQVYVGEQLVTELKVYTSVNTRPTGAMKEVPYEGFYKYQLEPDQSSSRENIEGKIHVTQVLQRHVLIPQKSGKLVIEPFESEWTVPQRIQNNRSGNALDDFFNDPFSDPFFDRVRQVPVKISTRPVTINVKSLPENAPGSFTGGVGDFSFNARLSANQVKVNESLSLIVEISGNGNIELIDPPKVDFPPDHDIYESTKNTTINTKGNSVSGKVTFEFPIVARHAGKFRIAPIQFSWFDPNVERYKTATTKEFVFSVEKVDGTAQDPKVYAPGTIGEDVENIGTDIVDIRRNIPAFRKIGQSPLHRGVYWITYLLLLLAFIATVTILRVYFSRRADVKLMRNRKASKMAKNRLRVADKARKSGNTEKFYEEIEKAIWGYLSDKLSIDLSALSRETVSEVLSTTGDHEELQEELIRIIDESEFSRYAPSSQKSDMDSLYADALKLIHNLEQNIRLK